MTIPELSEATGFSYNVLKLFCDRYNMPIDIVIEENNLKVLDKSGVVIKECNVVNGQKVDIDLFA